MFDIKEIARIAHGRMTATYSPLEEYGLIGNLETSALVSADGSIDWFCLPYMESPSVFAAILDDDKGGRFAIQPVGSFNTDQQYIEQTNVLQTTFHTDAGELTVTDFMPLRDVEHVGSPERALYRQVTCTEGTVDVETIFEPRFDYARARTTLEREAEGMRATSDDTTLFLDSPVSLQLPDNTAQKHDRAQGTFTINAHETQWYVLQYEDDRSLDHDTCERVLDETISFWHDWVHSCNGDCAYIGHGHDQIVRSELVLKLLTRRDTGAIYAAPTTSIPEDIGGVRNWDYRYSWLRDGTFTVRAFANLGHTREAKRFLDNFIERCHEVSPEKIRPLYDPARDDNISERVLDHLEGYRHSTPVRIGNRAATQRQLDIFGELILAIHQLRWTDTEVAQDVWESICDLVEYVRNVWDKPDAGIWEVRGEPRQFVYSKVMCWVAIDRAIKFGEDNGFEAPFEEWRETREEIHNTVIENGFDEERDSFTQTYANQRLDATGLLIPLMGFLRVDDRRVQGTIDAIRDQLTTDNGLVRRYDPGTDELPGGEGIFVLCTFWLINCLALTGRTEEARDRFETILEHSGPLGLFSEEIDPETGRMVGNFPQAFSHIGLINSALYLIENEKDPPAIDPFGSPHTNND